jgi:hypothetical protein
MRDLMEGAGNRNSPVVTGEVIVDVNRARDKLTHQSKNYKTIRAMVEVPRQQAEDRPDTDLSTCQLEQGD